MKDKSIEQFLESQDINIYSPEIKMTGKYLIQLISGYQQAQQETKWVSVSERLPEPSDYKQQTVMAVKSDQGYYNYKSMAWYGDNIGDGKLDFHVFDDLTCINKFKHTQVTHWMYIPD